MQTHNVTQELEKVLTQLQNEGKEPSMALVKARLSIPVPMPALITALKSWKASQRVPKVEVQTQATQSSTEDRILQLEQQIKTLTLRIEQLEGK